MICRIQITFKIHSTPCCLFCLDSSSVGRKVAKDCYILPLRMLRDQLKDLRYHV